MLFNFEPQTIFIPTKHGAATARELHTPVKLITSSTVDMATSPFAHPKTLNPLPKNNNKNTQEPQGQGSLPYSNPLSEEK